MRGRTRNFLENVGAFTFLIIVLLIAFLIVANYTNIGKALELEEIKDSIIEKFSEDKKDQNETIKSNKIVILQNEIKESNISNIENNTTQIEKVTKVNTKELEKKNNIQKEEQKKTQQVKTPKIKDIQVKNIQKENKKQEETQKTSDKKTNKENTPKEQEKNKPILSAKNLEKFTIINKFIKDTKTKIDTNVKTLNIPKGDSSRYANIRVTVLKDGNYEQLKLMDGDREYFNLIKDSILLSFPLKIDKKIDDQFPRYFRMKIVE